MAKSIKGTCAKSSPPTCEASRSAISSPGSGVGPTPCGLPDGPSESLFGPAHAPARPSARRGKSSNARRAREEKWCRIHTALVFSLAQGAGISGSPTSVTCGRISTSSSRSAALQRSLANRLRARTDLSGSPEYALRWKDWPTHLGPPICALRASARRTSGSGCSGWPSPMALCGWASPAAWDHKHANAKSYAERGGGTKGEQLCNQAVHLTGWNTPTVRDTRNSGGEGKNPRDLARQTALAGWATPNAADATGTHGGRQVTSLRTQASGPPSTCSPASTEKRGALNPEYSRWLMGYPAAWGCCGATAMQSCRKSPRSSSPRTARPGTRNQKHAV